MMLISIGNFVRAKLVTKNHSSNQICSDPKKDLYLLMYAQKNIRNLTRWLALVGGASVLLSFFEAFRSFIILAYVLYIFIMFRSKIYNLEDNWITTILLIFSLQALPEITEL